MKRLKSLVLTIALILAVIQTNGCDTVQGLFATPTPTPTSTPIPTNTPALTSTPTPIPGWEKFEGGGVELWLPESYEGGNPSEDIEVIIDKLRLLGPDFEQMAQVIKQNPSMFVLMALDSEVGDSGYITNVNIAKEKVLSAITLEIYLASVENQLPDQFQVVDQDIVSLIDHLAGRMIIEAAVLGVDIKEVVYIIKEDNIIWAISFATGAEEFDQRLQIFEQSIRTFAVQD